MGVLGAVGGKNFNINKVLFFAERQANACLAASRAKQVRGRFVKPG